MKQYSWSVWLESGYRSCILTEHHEDLMNAFWIDHNLMLIRGSFSGEIKRGKDYV